MVRSLLAFTCVELVVGGTVNIIRHGEKIWALGCLNDQGQARAQNLVDVFNGQPSEAHDSFDAPKAIFAHWYHDPIDCERCEQTVTPLAESLGIEIDRTHGGQQPGIGGGGGNPGAAKAIKEALAATGGPVLAAWEHVNIQYLTEDLGVEKADIPEWEGSDYDSVYVLEFTDDEAQTLVSFKPSAQNFSPSVLV